MGGGTTLLTSTFLTLVGSAVSVIGIVPLMDVRASPAAAEPLATPLPVLMSTVDGALMVGGIVTGLGLNVTCFDDEVSLDESLGILSKLDIS